jgi:Domain of unknown function (DUF1857)
MRFEHLIQINDPLNRLITPMSREQLWTGLMQRVHAPQRFPVGPQDCEVEVGSDPLLLRRRIDFGSLSLHDVVQIDPGVSLSFTPLPHEDMALIHLTLTVENHPVHDPEALFLRFVYESEVDDPDTDGYRQQAWLENDRDMVRTLREWQESGLL